MMTATWSAFWAEQSGAFWTALGEHVFLTLLSTSLAVLLGVGLGMLVFRWRALQRPVLGLAGIIQTIPGLALLALLLALMGRIGALPALVALTLYALLPILRGTLTGLQSVPPALGDVSRVIGMTALQQLWMVQLPLALPQIISSVRVAANIGVGLATIAAFIGAGGLGQFINRGLFLSDTRLILLGAIPAAVLAVLLDQLIALLERGYLRRRKAERADLSRAGRGLLALLTLLPLLLMAGGAYLAFRPLEPSSSGRVVIGTKNFTEQIILGEIIAQAIETRTPLTVERRFGLGGSPMLHRAALAGEIHLFPEYTGTAMTAILKEERVPSLDVYAFVRDLYQRRFQLQLFPPLGFNNSYVLTMRCEQAKTLGIRRLSDLKEKGRTLRAAVDFEFAERRDGLKGLMLHHGIRFASVRDIDPTIIYDVLASGQADIISAYGTDGRIASHGFLPLEDDLGFFPPYHAVIVARQDVLRRHRKLAPVLRRLTGTIDDARMRRMNHAVDHDHVPVAEVARAFLAELADE